MDSYKIKISTNHNEYDIYDLPSISSFKLVKEGESWDLPLSFKPVSDTTYWLLSVLFTSGDSFKPSSFTVLEFIDLYRDSSIAGKNARRIVDRDKKYRTARFSLNEKDKKYFENFFLTNHKGEKFYKGSYVPWEGYFENLQSVLTTPVQLVNERNTQIDWLND